MANRLQLLFTFVVFSTLVSFGQDKRPSADAIKFSSSFSLNSSQADDVISTSSQTNDASDYERGCSSYEHELQMRAKYPQMGTIQDFEAWMKEKQQERSQYQLRVAERCGIKYIPYVVHIIHDGEAVNTIGNVVGNNISAAQVYAQMDALDRDFRKLNLDRDNDQIWDNVSADLQMEFIPAVVDPDGNMLAEPGIDRVNAPAEGLSGSPYNDLDAEIKPATFWDPDRYLNIWVADLSGGLLGYAQFPSMSGLTGMPVNGGPAETDGVVMDTETFTYAPEDDGSFTATGGPFVNGRTTTHEIGHWIGLRHIGGDGGCGADDFCLDTPAQNGQTNGCPTGQDSCDDGPGDLPDQTPNYMDYTDDVCMNIFTQDQKDRMEIVFDNSPRRGVLFSSDVADAPVEDPEVVFEVDGLTRDVAEPQGCAPFEVYNLNVTLTDCVLTPSTGDIEVTVTLDGSSTAVEGVDFDFDSGSTALFSGIGSETVGIPIRIYNDGEMDPSEQLVFNLSSINSNGSEAYISTDANYTQATWTIADAGMPTGNADVTFEASELPGGGSTCVNGDLNLSITFDNFPQETSWEIRELGGAIVASGGTYGSEPDGSTLDIPIMVPGGDYTFTIFDSFGDGICCGFGNGSYTFTSADGTEIASGGNFGSEDATDFCVETGASRPQSLPINGFMEEDPDCLGFPFTDYILQASISGCVEAEKDVTVEVQIDPASTATLGTDFTFEASTTYVFNGEDAEAFQIPIRVLADGVMEGNETLILNLVPTVNADLVNVNPIGTTSLTIVDSDLPVVSFSEANITVSESDEYNCTGTGNTVMIGVDMSSCTASGSDIVVSLVAGTGSTASAEDYTLPASLTFPAGSTNETQFFELTVINDYISEGDELLELIVEFTDPSGAVAGSLPMNLTIRDALGNRAPGLTQDLFTDFESGDRSGWTVTGSAMEPNWFTVGMNSDLDNYAAYISNDPFGTKPHTYGPTDEGNQIVLLLSPPFEMTDDETFVDFVFQAEGEAGFFGAFDFGTFGLVDGTIDPTNYDAVVASYQGNTQTALAFNPTPIVLSDLIGEYDIKSDINVSGLVRLAFAWVSDFSIQNNPPLAVDNISIDGAEFIDFTIAENITPVDSRPQYPVTEGSSSYYYDTPNAKIISSISGSSEDLGCTTSYIDREGTSAVRFITDIEDEYAASKTYIVEPEMASSTVGYTISLYYTEAELAGWEAATGRDRSELQMFKTDGSPVSAVATDCVDFDSINFSPITITDYPFSDGYVLTASFTGIESITGFGIASISSLSPVNFTAVQNKEQVDISWESAYFEDNISHYILQEIFPDTNTVRELATKFDKVGSYEVTDFFPNNGLNIYRLIVVLKNGQRYVLCNDANARYDATTQIKVVPNPASDIVTLIASDEDLRNVVGISLLDELGRVVMTQDVISNTGVLRYNFDISGIAAGTYFFRLDGEGESRVVSFIKVSE